MRNNTLVYLCSYCKYLFCIISFLLDDEHSGIKVSIPPIKGAMDKFIRKKQACIGCKIGLSDDQSVVCKQCESQQGQLYIKQMDKVREHEQLFTRAWTQCQRCQGSLHQEVLCTNKDCPIFYQRTKVQTDLCKAQKELERFDF